MELLWRYCCWVAIASLASISLADRAAAQSERACLGACQPELANAVPAVDNYTGLSTTPLPGAIEVGLAYGWRSPATPGAERQFHSGIDLLAAPGTPVVAAEAGQVAFVGQQGGYGNLVIVNHAGGRQTRYAHLASLAVTLNQRVSAGSPVGTVGTTGQPDIAAPHLHFEVRSQRSIGWVAQDPALHLKLGTPQQGFWQQ